MCAPGCQEIYMFRYVALAWDSTDANQTNSARLFGERLQSRQKTWGRVGEQVGLCVFYTSSRHESLHAQPLPRGSGVLLGSLFQRNRDCADDTAAARFTPDHQQS